MTSEVEAHFREAERQLDDVMRRDKEVMISSGIEIFDESQRLYHYKNSYLSWSFRFETRRACGSEIEKIWGRLSVTEDDPTVAKLWRRAEIFQIGQAPRWHETSEQVIPLDALVRIGLATMIANEIDEGRTAAARAG